MKACYSRHVTGSELTCAWCGRAFIKPNARGPDPRYCSRAHRQRAHEGRQALRVAEGSAVLATRATLDERNPLAQIGTAMLSQGATADTLKALGGIQTNQSALLALKAYESAALVKRMIPSREWLEAASLLSAQSGLGISIRNLGAISSQIAIGASSLRVRVSIGRAV